MSTTVTPTSYGNKKYTKPYDNGWDNPTTHPPLTAGTMNGISDGLNNIDNYLLGNTGNYLELTVDQETTITLKATGHTYIVLKFEGTVYNVTFATDPSGQTITYDSGSAPQFEANSTYELSFLNLYCIWKKRKNS